MCRTKHSDRSNQNVQQYHGKPQSYSSQSKPLTHRPYNSTYNVSQNEEAHNSTSGDSSPMIGAVNAIANKSTSMRTVMVDGNHLQCIADTGADGNIIAKSQLSSTSVRRISPTQTRLRAWGGFDLPVCA